MSNIPRTSKINVTKVGKSDFKAPNRGLEEELSLLGCDSDSVLTGKHVMLFWGGRPCCFLLEGRLWRQQPPLVAVYQLTQLHAPEGLNLDEHCDNLTCKMCAGF
jgi:hypothetical protein